MSKKAIAHKPPKASLGDEMRNVMFAPGRIICAMCMAFVGVPSYATTHVTQSSNISGNSSFLDIGLGNAEAVLQITSNWNPNGRTSGAYNESPLGIWYQDSHWLIFNQNVTPMPQDVGFNITKDLTGFIHRAKPATINKNSTTLDYPDLRDRSLRLLVTPVWNPPGSSGVYNNHPIGIWYDEGAGQWLIFNQDKIVMPHGAAFNVSVVDEALIHRATTGNTFGYMTYLDVGASDPNAELFITQFWNPDGPIGIYNPHTVGVWYDGARGRWAIFNIDRQPMPIGAAFIVGQSLPSELLNRSFEEGYSHWALEGDAFGSVPNDGIGIPAKRAIRAMRLENGGIGGDYWYDVLYPIGVKGRYWASSGERVEHADDLPRSAATGAIVSNDFLMHQPFLSFLISGRDANEPLPVPTFQPPFRPSGPSGTVVGVELQRYDPTAPQGYRILVVSTPGAYGDNFRRQTWDLRELGLTDAELRRGVRMRVVVRDESVTGYVNVDDFRLTDARPPTIQGLSIPENHQPIGMWPPPESVGAILERDPDHPVWGFADTHAHPTSQLGYGGGTIVGENEGSIDSAISTRMCSVHGHNPIIDLLDQHHSEASPTFSGWPRFTSKFHQQHHVEWIRRAYDGGLRIMVALGVNNMFWATRALIPRADPPIPVDDEGSVLLQVEKMKEIAENNRTWMEVALSPADARRIIHQNKLAIVLGVEMDSFGNFKKASYLWHDWAPPSLPLTALPTEPAAAAVEIANKVDQYYRAGIRQVTPLHYVSGLFGGTAAFRGDFALQNWVLTNERYKLTDGVEQGVYLNIADEFDPAHALAGAAIEILARRPTTFWDADSGAISTVNAEALEPAGFQMFTELMRRGMLVDAEHASRLAATDVYNLACQFDYPVMSSHTDPQTLNFHSDRTRFSGSDEEKIRAFGTTNIHNLAHEGNLSDDAYGRVARSGGTVGVLTFPFRRRPYGIPDAPANSDCEVGWRAPTGSPANDCAGSSKSFVQIYKHSVSRMNGKGVAIATDRGFNDFAGPRFGPWAAYSLTEEKPDSLRKKCRTSQRYVQTNGVRYEPNALQDWNPARFEQNDIDPTEEDAWKALAYRNATGIDPNDTVTYSRLPMELQVPISRDQWLHRERILHFVKGLAQTEESGLLHFEPGELELGDMVWEEAAMFCLQRGIAPARLTSYAPHQQDRIQQMLNKVEPAFQLWREMSGTNVPLRKRVDGQRDWDINIDGIAHYGMLPDFFQDVKNDGVH
jgi:microsomal dipeptidase-like Zn-dependent dipeptidase